MTKKLRQKLDIFLENVGDMALKRRAKRMIEELDPEDGDKILDVGCGDGYYLHLLSQLGLNLSLTGADYDVKGLESARKNLGKKIPLFQADLMKKLPFKNNIFDKVVMSEVAEHLPDDLRGLKEVLRVLKPGGTLVLTVPNHNYPMFWDPANWILERITGNHVKSGFWAGIWNQHVRLYKPEEIKKVTEKAGFSVKKVESLTWWCLPFNHNLLNLAARLLYGGKLSPSIGKAISKYEVKKIKRPFLVDGIFAFVSSLDRLNDRFTPPNRGVGVFIKAVK